MSDKTPVRVVFNASNVATGMAEFQTGESVPVINGGTGLTAVGSAGQVLKVNAAGNALEFGAEGDISITNLVAPTNSDLTLTTSGTGNIILDAITFRGTTISSADSSIININEGVVVDGTLNTSGQATLSGLAYPTSDGSVGQFLKTDGSGTLAFADLSLGDLTIIGSTISVPSNADFILDPSGTGAIKLNANTDITGNLTVTGTLDLGDSNFTNVGSLQLDSIAGDGDTNTSITFSGSDVITVATGGSTAATFNADQSVTFNSTVTMSGGQAIPGKLEGTNFTNSLLIGHSTTGTLNAANYNTGVGIETLDALTSGDSNTAIGKGAGTAITTGGNNTAIGKSSLLTVSTGSQNTAMGKDALKLTTGDYNIGIGYTAGANITSGDGNIIIGNIDVDSASGDNQLIIAGGYTGAVQWIKGDSSGNLTTVGDVTLANYGKLLSNAGLEINVPGSNEDFRITGNDAGTAITPLLMDMSAGGNLTLTGGSGNVQTWARRDTSASLTLAFPSAKATFSSSHSLIYNCAGSEKMRLENDGTLLLGTTDDGEAGAGDMVVAGGIFLGGNAAANELDDYEEGTFTPAILPNGGSVTNATQTGHYTKIGRIVYFDIRVGISAISSPTGTLKVAGLPFNGGIGGRAGLVSIATINNCGSLTLANTLGSYISTGDAVHIVSNDGSNNNAPQLTATTQFDISGMYQTT